MRPAVVSSCEWRRRPRATAKVEWTRRGRVPARARHPRAAAAASSGSWRRLGVEAISASTSLATYRPRPRDLAIASRPSGRLARTGREGRRGVVAGSWGKGLEIGGRRGRNPGRTGGPMEGNARRRQLRAGLADAHASVRESRREGEAEGRRRLHHDTTRYDIRWSRFRNRDRDTCTS